MLIFPRFQATNEPQRIPNALELGMLTRIKEVQIFNEMLDKNTMLNETCKLGHAKTTLGFFDSSKRF